MLAPRHTLKHTALLFITPRRAGRSALACRTLQLMGYDNVYNLAGGYDEWQREELPVEQVEATKFP